MADSDIRYYILFANYEQGLALRDLLLEADIPNRIAPAPRAIQGEQIGRASCRERVFYSV